MVRYSFDTIGDLTYQSPLVSQSTGCLISYGFLNSPNGTKL